MKKKHRTSAKFERDLLSGALAIASVLLLKLIEDILTDKTNDAINNHRRHRKDHEYVAYEEVKK